MEFVELIISIIIFIFGLAIGSFLNVIVYRLEHNEKLNGRSYCPHCRHTLTWLDLFPVVSFLFLQGRCRYCSKKISMQYPLLETATGLIFILIFNQSTQIFNLSALVLNSLDLLFIFYISSVLIIIFLYDLKHYIIPDQILFPAIIISFMYRFLNSFHMKSSELIVGLANVKFEILTLGNYIFAAIVASAFFLLIYLVSHGEWMGFGDVKLAILLGLMLGWPNILLAIFLAFFFGAIIGVGLIVLDLRAQAYLKRSTRLEFKDSSGKPLKSKLPLGLKSQIPFAPFLITGTFVAMFWGQQIMNWYLHFLII